MSQEKERLLARKAKIDARLAAIAEADAKRREKEEQRKADLAGRAVLRRARKDKEFAARLRKILDAEITGQRNRTLFDLPPKANGSGGAACASGAASDGADRVSQEPVPGQTTPA
jgi:hypothetical protein